MTAQGSGEWPDGWVPAVGFGQRLLLARRQSGVSQGELAAAIESTQQAVNKWEHGGSPRGDLGVLARRISEVLGCSAAWLVFGDDYRESSRSERHAGGVTPGLNNGTYRASCNNAASPTMVQGGPRRIPLAA